MNVLFDLISGYFGLLNFARSNLCYSSIKSNHEIGMDALFCSPSSFTETNGHL